MLVGFFGNELREIVLVRCFVVMILVMIFIFLDGA